MVVPTVLHELVRKPWLVWIAIAGGVGCQEGGWWWVQAGANVCAPVPAYLLVFLVLPVSSNPQPPTRSTPHSPHLARRVDQARELKGGRNHRLCSGGGTCGRGCCQPNVRHHPPVCVVTTCTARDARCGAASASPVNE